MVTAELAMASVGAVALLIILVGVLAIGVQQVHCVDTAAEVARQAARGDEEAESAARGKAPAGATVEVTKEGGFVVATVRLESRLLHWLPAVPLGSTASVLLEPGESGP